MPKLTPVQQKVMGWMVNGWRATQSAGCSVEINGRRFCNIDTMTALERHGFAERVGLYQWQATEAGREYVKAEQPV